MDELERILSAPDDLEPRAGFLEAVLAATTEDAVAPPLRFPWARFALGVAACLVTAVAGTALLTPVAESLPELGYAALAVIGSLLLATLPRLYQRMI